MFSFATKQIVKENSSQYSVQLDLKPCHLELKYLQQTELNYLKL